MPHGSDANDEKIADGSARALSPKALALPARAGLLVVAASIVLVAAVAVLFAANVPLGVPPRFTYSYSPIVVRRLLQTPDVLIPAAILAVAVLMSAAARRAVRRIGLVAGLAGVVVLAAWTYKAPPDARSQHAINFLSPSQDGAFLIEAETVDGVRPYLRQFPQRAATPPAELKGTRVISNPPGTTLLAVAVRRTLGAWPAARRSAADESMSEIKLWQITWALATAVVLTGFWALSLLLLYAAARVLLPMPAAMAVAVGGGVSAMTLCFTPGKDPAQLLTVAAFLWPWLVAVRPVVCTDGGDDGRSGTLRRTLAAAAAGAALVASLLVSLVHVWIAACVIGATLVCAWRAAALRRVLWTAFVPAVLAGAAALGAFYWLADCNMFAIAAATARAQAEVTRGSDATPWLVQAVGIPLFLLLCGPALWCVALLSCTSREHDGPARFGAALFVITAVVMVATVGFTNMETPRLWIPFAPLLMLGAALQLPMLRSVNRSAARLLAMFVAAQVLVAVGQWAFLDMRESESRLIGDQPRFFSSRNPGIITAALSPVGIKRSVESADPACMIVGFLDERQQRSIGPRASRLVPEPVKPGGPSPVAQAFLSVFHESTG